MECCICLSNYDLRNHVAIKLKCSHTVCKVCYRNIEIKDEIPCPLCFKRTKSEPSPNECQTIKEILSGSSPELNFSQTILLIVKNLMNKVIEIEISVDEKIIDLKSIIQNIENINTKHQGLLFNGVYLKDDLTLKDYNLRSGNIIYLVTRSLGG